MSVTITAAIAIVIGIVSSFFGQRIYRIILAVYGFFVGFAFGTALMAGQSDLAVLVVGVIAGVALGALLYYLYGLAFALFGAALGVAVAVSLATLIGVTEGTLLAVIFLIGGVIGAVIGYIARAIIIVIATAIVGAVQIVNGIALLIPDLPLAQPGVEPDEAGILSGIINVIAIAVIAGIGAAYQFRNLRRE
ncbi:MAG: TMEM198/TM7SF3 family protein [Chloroflexi bacterium]|nr:TMEM198/TM7SF3 family protein [Chloroflexota bacterium]